MKPWVMFGNIKHQSLYLSALTLLKPPFWTLRSKSLLFDAHTKKAMCCQITVCGNSTMNYIYISTITKDLFQLFLSGFQTTGRKQRCFFPCTDSLHTPHSPGDKLQPVFTVNYNLCSTFTATDNSQLTFLSCAAPLAATSLLTIWKLLLSTLICSYWPFRAAIEYYLLITSRFLPVLFRLHLHKWSTNIHLSPNYEHTSSFFCSTRYSTPSCPKLKTLRCMLSGTISWERRFVVLSLSWDCYITSGDKL